MVYVLHRKLHFFLKLRQKHNGHFRGILISKKNTITFFLFRLITWPEVRMSVGNSFLSQGHRPASANKTHSKDDWLRQVKNHFFYC